VSLADLLKKGSLRQFATMTAATVATVRPGALQSVASVAPVSVTTARRKVADDPAQVFELVAKNKVARKVAATAVLFENPDQWVWPHSRAMTSAEIDTFTARLDRFTQRGLVESDAEKLADSLVTRDRDADDRRLCLECAYLAWRAGVWECRNWQRAGIARKARDAQLSRALVIQLQRCNGFTDQNQQGTATWTNCQTWTP